MAQSMRKKTQKIEVRALPGQQESQAQQSNMGNIADHKWVQ